MTTVADDVSATELNSAWNALAYGLGQLLDGLADLDFATFAVGGRTVLSVSRDGSDVWVLASGPEDEVEPIELTARQREVLRNAHFAPPQGPRAERSAQRANWWFRVPLPADAIAFDTAGSRMVSALRGVYGAERPADVTWRGMALSDGTRSVLDALPLTRSPYQRS